MDKRFYTPNLVKIPGKKIGKITPIDISHIHENGHTYWNCICDCGKHIKIRRDTLIRAINNNWNRGCGCMNKSKGNYRQSSCNWKGYKNISKSTFNSVKYKAKIRNIIFNISIEDMNHQWEIQNGLCALTKLPLNFGLNARDNHTTSLDRIDSLKGYTIDNIQWVHKDINTMKWNFNQEHFIEMCRLVTKNNHPV